MQMALGLLGALAYALSSDSLHICVSWGLPSGQGLWRVGRVDGGQDGEGASGPPVGGDNHTINKGL